LLPIDARALLTTSLRPDVPADRCAGARLGLADGRL